MNDRLINSRPRIALWLSLVLGVVLVILVAGNYAFSRFYQNRVLPNVVVGNLNLGGQDLTQANQLVTQVTIDAKSKKLTLVTAAFSNTYALSDLGVKFDESKTIRQLREFGRSGSLLVDFRHRILSLIGPTRVPVAFNSGETLTQTIKQLAGKINRGPIEANLNIDKQQLQIKESVEGRELDLEKLRLTIDERLANLDFKPIVIPIKIFSPKRDTNLAKIVSEKIVYSLKFPYELTFKEKIFNLASSDLWNWLQIAPTSDNFVVKLDENKLTAYFKDLALQIDQPMQNAAFKMTGDQVVEFKPDKSGAVLRIKDAVNLININLLTSQRKLELPINALEPKVKLSSLNSLGIDELVASGKSNFAGSPKNRRHNIAVGVKRFNLMLIPPESTFSFGTALGEVSAATGYLPEMVIKGDETIPEYGGGLCQVSTTAFRAILDGGYPVVERKAHAYRVIYYEPAGLDATIYPPSPDLKFTNDSPGYILINAYVINNNAYFDFYGTKTNRSVKIEGPFVSNVTDYLEPIYVETSTLPVGEVKRIDSAHRGADAVFYRYIYDGNGKLITKDTFKSHYVPWPAKYLVGVPEAPALETNLKNIGPDENIIKQP